MPDLNASRNLLLAAIANQRTGRPKVWTTDAIVLAIQEWVERHGRIPTYREWSNVTADHPNARTVGYVIGWDAAIERAGFTPRGRGRPRREP